MKEEADRRADKMAEKIEDALTEAGWREEFDDFLDDIVTYPVAIMAGLMPIMWSHGTGSEVMKRIAAPMVGGMVSATILTLVVVPAIYGLWKGWKLPKE